MATSSPPTGQSPQQFDYQAQSSAGQALRGSLEAASLTDATAQLQALGLRVLAITPAAKATTPRRLNVDDFLLFNQQLAHLTAAGLPVERGLRLIAADLRSGRLSAAANSVAADLEKGATLRDAFDRHARQFPALYAGLIDAGVKTGNLPALLFSLGRHLELTARLRRALWRTLSYPAAVMIVLGGVLLFISLSVLPVMRQVLSDFTVDYFTEFTLPAPTRFLLNSGPMIPYIVAAGALIVLIFILCLLALRWAGKDGVIIDRIILPLPLIGPIVRRSILARWCDSLRIGIEAGLDLPQALSLASNSVGSPRLAAESCILGDTLVQGTPVTTFSGSLIPPTVPAAIEFGSRTGELPSTLATLTRMYEQQADQRIRAIPSILTPLLLVIIAIVIGGILMALFLPVLRLLQAVSGGY